MVWYDEEARRILLSHLCPNCGAKPGKPCVGRDGRSRDTFHRERKKVSWNGGGESPTIVEDNKTVDDINNWIATHPGRYTGEEFKEMENLALRWARVPFLTTGGGKHRVLFDRSNEKLLMFMQVIALLATRGKQPKV